MSDPKVQPDLQEADQKIGKAIDKEKGGSDEGLIRLSTGVVLRAKQANPHVLIRIMTALPRPNPPMYMNTALGRMMENHQDPDYIKRVEAWEMQYSNGMLNALVGLGTELVSTPKGFQKPDSKEWLRDYQALGLNTFPESPAWLYTTWVLYVAAPTEQDTKTISEKVKSLSGIMEANVRDVENFPKSD